MEEEKVFINFSAVLSVNVMGVKVWQTLNLTTRKLQIQIIVKKWFCFTYCTMGDIKSIKYIILNR